MMCHSRQHRPRVQAPPAEPPARRDPELRASDYERESTVSQLREHRAAGRLDLEELEQRSGAAYAARTHDELADLLADLPGQAVRRPSAHRRWQGGHEWGGFLQVNLLLIAIWAISGAGYFWPAWVIVWWGVALALRSGPQLLRLGQ